MCEKARSHPESKECTKGANVAARIVSKGKRVSPEEPLTLNLSIAKAKKTDTYLERNYSCTKHTNEDHRQRIFSTQQARIEESSARNHDPHKSGGYQYPDNITQAIGDDLPSARVRIDELLS